MNTDKRVKLKRCRRQPRGLRLRRLIAEAEADVKAGRVVTWGEFLQHERRRCRSSTATRPGNS